METQKIIAGIVAGGTLVMGGVDASVLNETPIAKTEIIKNERIEAKQVGNVVDTTFPWKGENGLKVKYDMGEPTAAEMLKDKRDKQVITERVDFADDGGFKIDIILDKKPDTNVFCYTIEGAENYSFEYQPPLNKDQNIKLERGETVTETQYFDAEGRLKLERPIDIVGSYAVIHKTLKNHKDGGIDYGTGKVMHIPRPQVWEVDDATNTKQWADLSYNNGQLCVTAPQSFLDKAKYPVRIDPTFGYTSAGASDILSQSSYSDRGAMKGTNIQGTVTGLSGYFKCQSAGTNACTWNTTFYGDSSGPSGLLINNSNTAMTGTTYQLKTNAESYAFSCGDYWVVGSPQFNGTGGRLAYDTTGGTPGDNGISFDFGAWDTSNSYLISVYVTYTDGGACGGGGEETKQDSDFWFE